MRLRISGKGGPADSLRLEISTMLDVGRTLVVATALLGGAFTRTAADGQDQLEPVINAGARVLEFDWPMVRVGTAEYAEGPTGVTVFRFGRRVLAAIDVRGGGPGTVNSDYLRMGYEKPAVDAVVISGGSW